MIKVSVIVPVYNVRMCLDKCLNSLVKQTLKDIEIIVVNDGSTDDSQLIIDKYVQKYPSKVKSYIKENGGQGSARNYGFSVATGEYIGFVDSDDYVENNMFYDMYKNGIKNNSDIVICGMNYIYQDKVEKVLPFNKLKITKKECILSAPAIWNKIYKKDYLIKENFAFDKGIIYEDLALIPYLYINALNITYVKKPLYNYVIRTNSTMNQLKYNPKINNIFEACNNLYERFINYPEYRNELEILFIEHLMYNSSFRFYQFKESKKNILKISDIMKEKFPDWEKNPIVKKYSKKDRFILKMFYRKQIWIIDILVKIKKWSKCEKNKRNSAGL